MENAPLYNELAGAPLDGRAYWATCEDGVRVRVAVWGGQARGTVLILPGRGEYIEKYGEVVAPFAKRGLNTVILDFRGQGLSDRLTDDPQSGFVRDFQEYQSDINAMLALEAVTSLAGPRILLAHSMGGAIAYRTLSEGLDVVCALLSAPMFELQMNPLQRPLLKLVSRLAVLTGLGKRYLPQTGPDPYVISGKFEGNTLTSSKPEFERLTHIAKEHPELVIGGPSLTWISAAMREATNLRHLPPPRLPVLSLMGTEETLVRRDLIENFSQKMHAGDLVDFPGGRHELLVETPEIREHVWQAIDEFLELSLEREA